MRSVRVASIAALAVVLALGTAPLAAATAGSSGVGDPYYPLDGNGGYDVQHYDLGLTYHPDTGLLQGRTTIQATASQRLTRFNLDLVGLTVRSIKVQGAPATWTRTGHELRVTPATAVPDDQRFTVLITYDGTPEPFNEPSIGRMGFFPTDDGFDIAGQPHGAATYFPVNDHPTDKASYTFRVTVPNDRKVMANGLLVGTRTNGDWTTWTWDAPDPMASYLATVDVGEWTTSAFKVGRIRYHNAIDPDLFDGRAVPHGQRFAVSQAADSSYKRLTRRINVPAGETTVGFTVTRDTEQDWDFAFVEVHTRGQDDWTTLEDQNGHTTQDPGNSCLTWPDLHPFISDHYLSVDQDAPSCEPTGATGEWWAASGRSDGPEQWQVDLSAYAGTSVELSISYVSDEVVQGSGVFVDDITLSRGAGSTDFEAGSNGWTASGPPAGSPGNTNDWRIGTAADGQNTTGDIAQGAMNREPEVLRFLAGYFGPYPWDDAGAIVDDIDGLGFALETQTRPIYSKDFFTDPESGAGVLVHENAHQWYGDSLAVHRWSDIWLNEGFATYAEWLWSEHTGAGTPQQIFDFFYNDFIPDDDPWWDITVGDPSPEKLFEYPVYFRGAMTLQVLRNTVGDDAFFHILKSWASSRAGGNVSTPEFVALAERVSGQQLDDLFDTWLFTPGRPVIDEAVASPAGHAPIPLVGKTALRIRAEAAD